MLTSKVCSRGCDISAVTVFSLCSECALSHSGLFPQFIHTIKMLTRLFMSFHTWESISNFSVREKFTYLPDSVFVLCFLPSSPSINNLHKTCTYLQQADGLFLKGCAHRKKKQHIAKWVFTKSMRYDGRLWCYKHIRHLPHTVHATLDSHSTLWHSKWDYDILHQTQSDCYRFQSYRTHI